MMNDIPIWKEHAIFVNRKSVISITLLVIAGIALAGVDTPGSGHKAGTAIILILAVYLTAVATFSSIKVTRSHITVGLFPYRKKIKVSDVLITEIRILKSGEDPSLKLRRNGISLPGLHLGWFSTSSEKPAFAATSGRRGRLFIPTRTHYDLIVTSRSPKMILQALRSTTQWSEGNSD